MSTILIGISAWADAGLVRSGFYPPGVDTPEQRLRYYAGRFPLAEIDSTYHSFATARSQSLWVDNTPEGFLFNLKAFSMFTLHPTPFQSLPRNFRERYAGSIAQKANLYPQHLSEEALDDLWSGFARTAASLQERRRLGAILFQFPPWFHPTPQNFDHIADCRRRLPDLPLAVEFRVGSWLMEEHVDRTLDLLRSNRIALVCVDEPQGLKSSVPPVTAVTAPLAVVRFHGRNREKWEARGTGPDDRFDYLYSEAELVEWVPRIRQLAGTAETLQVIFKNKHADYPVRNAVRMKELLAGWHPVS